MNTDLLHVDLIMKIAGIGIIVAVIEQLLSKAGKDEYALIVTLMGLVVVMMILVPEISNLFDMVRDTFNL